MPMIQGCIWTATAPLLTIPRFSEVRAEAVARLPFSLLLRLRWVSTKDRSALIAAHAKPRVEPSVLKHIVLDDVLLTAFVFLQLNPRGRTLLKFTH